MAYNSHITVAEFCQFENSLNTVEDWEKIWTKGDMDFLVKVVHPQLVKFNHLLLPQDCQNFNVLVPLSGKSSDLLWLARKGANVVGTEFVSLACESFFKENGIPFVIEDIDNISGHVYRSTDDNLNIRIFQCDHLLLTPQIVGCTFDAIWDRGAFNSIPIKSREEYIKHMMSLLVSSANVLVAVTDYEIVDENNVDHGLPPTAEDSVLVAFQPFASSIEQIDKSVTMTYHEGDEICDVSEVLFKIVFK